MRRSTELALLCLLLLVALAAEPLTFAPEVVPADSCEITVQVPQSYQREQKDERGAIWRDPADPVNTLVLSAEGYSAPSRDEGAKGVEAFIHTLRLAEKRGFELIVEKGTLRSGPHYLPTVFFELHSPRTVSVGYCVVGHSKNITCVFEVRPEIFRQSGLRGAVTSLRVKLP